MHHHGHPKILNADWGSAFMSIEIIKLQKEADVRISTVCIGVRRGNIVVDPLRQAKK